MNKPHTKSKHRLKISPLFLVLAAVMVYLNFWHELVIYFVCIVLHELAHAETARNLGYCLNYIKLMPYGAGLTGEFEGAKWSDEVIIAIAGPLFNILIALFLMAFWWIEPVSFLFTEKIVLASFFTAVFNILPVFPLDGGRALLAFLSTKTKRQRAYHLLRIVGYVFSAIFVCLFALSIIKGVNISFALIAIFLLLSTAFPDKNSKYQRLYSMAFRGEKLKKGIIIREVIIGDSATLISLMRQINSNYYYRFEVVNSNMKRIALIDEMRLETLLKSNHPETTIASALKNSSIN